MEDYQNNRLMISDIASNFTANTTLGDISLSDYNGKWVLIFSHPR